ncbi:MAG: hypothetical protein JWM96_226 [Alphaproteobacteria bacterium]|nr:hypothetical protein [Alphaproteobacteria bacterium]
MFSAIKRFSAKRESDDLARAFARCFQEHDGQVVLEYLHQHVFFRSTDPAQTDAQLRFAEGQRQLLLFICQLIAKGRGE